MISIVNACTLRALAAIARLDRVNDRPVDIGLPGQAGQ
jgi:hypothetical protein